MFVFSSMSDFKAKMHQIRFPLGLRPRPRWRSLQRSPDPFAVFKEPTSKGREGKGSGAEGGGEGNGKERGGEGGREGDGGREGPVKSVKPIGPAW